MANKKICTDLEIMWDVNIDGKLESKELCVWTPWSGVSNFNIAWLNLTSSELDCSNWAFLWYNNNWDVAKMQWKKIIYDENTTWISLDTPFLNNGNNNFYDNLCNYSYTNNTNCPVKVTAAVNGLFFLRYKGSWVFNWTQPAASYQIAFEFRVEINWSVIQNNMVFAHYLYMETWVRQLITQQGTWYCDYVLQPWDTVRLYDRIIWTWQDFANLSAHVRYARRNIRVETL